jgi:hypothetical protein
VGGGERQERREKERKGKEADMEAGKRCHIAGLMMEKEAVMTKGIKAASRN